MKWVFGVVLFLVTVYLALFGMVAFTMSRPPEQFGQIMKHLARTAVTRLSLREASTWFNYINRVADALGVGRD